MSTLPQASPAASEPTHQPRCWIQRPTPNFQLHSMQRILILSTSAGTGHVRCAQALEKAFTADPRAGEVRHADALDYTNKAFRDLYSKLYMQLVRNAPHLLGWAY